MKIFFLIVIVTFLFNGSTVSAAGIQKWVDENGQAHYGERPPANQKTGTIKNNISVVTVDVGATMPSVILYSTSRCGYCKKAKAFMSANKIQYREYDIEKNAVAHSEYKRMGGKGVPLLVMQDRTLHGFSSLSYQSFFGI